MRRRTLLAAPAGLLFLRHARADQRAELIELINDYRASLGLRALRESSLLMGIAQARADQEASEDDDLDHREFGAAMQAAGWAWDAGENVAGGYTTPAQVLLAWQTSPGHYQNLVDHRWTEIGIGQVARPGSHWGVYWAAIFGARTIDDPPSYRVFVPGVAT